MSCSAFDWNAYALGELDVNHRHEAEAHAATCPACRDELARLRLTLDALSTLREEEVPRRIAFVSDKVFEPRWWQKVSQVFLRPSFAAGCAIAAAILVHAFVRPAATAPAIDTAKVEAQIEARVESDVSRRLDAAVAKAVAQTEQRPSVQAQELLAASEKRFAEQRRADFASFAANYDMLARQINMVTAINTGAGHSPGLGVSQ